MIAAADIDSSAYPAEAGAVAMGVESLGFYQYEISGSETQMLKFLEYIRARKSPKMDESEIIKTLPQSSNESAALNFGIWRFIFLRRAESGMVVMKARINGGEANTNEFGPAMEAMIYEAIKSINH